MLTHRLRALVVGFAVLSFFATGAACFAELALVTVSEDGLLDSYEFSVRVQAANGELVETSGEVLDELEREGAITQRNMEQFPSRIRDGVRLIIDGAANETEDDSRDSIAETARRYGGKEHWRSKAGPPALMVDVPVREVEAFLSETAGRFQVLNFDEVSELFLKQSVPLVVEDTNGSGTSLDEQQYWPWGTWHAAVIDTGVEGSALLTHLAGRVDAAWGICFSAGPAIDGQDQTGYQSLCPNGMDFEEGLNAGRPCDTSVLAINPTSPLAAACLHGTAVASVISSRRAPHIGVIDNDNFKILPVMVFSFFHDPDPMPYLPTWMRD